MKIKRAKSDISIYRGDTPTYIYQLKGVNPDTSEKLPVDITNAVITGQVRYTSESIEPWLVLPITKVDAPNGIFQWTLTKQQSEDLLPVGSFEPDQASYDIQIEMNGNVFTFLYGSFLVTRDITRV